MSNGSDWFMIMVDANGVSPARVFEPIASIAEPGDSNTYSWIGHNGETQSAALGDSYCVERRNSAFTWPVDPLDIISSNPPGDTNWRGDVNLDRRGAAMTPWGGYLARYLKPGQSRAQYGGPWHADFGVSFAASPHKIPLLRYDFAAWTITGENTFTTTTHTNPTWSLTTLVRPMGPSPGLFGGTRPACAAPVVLIGTATAVHWNGLQHPAGIHHGNFPPRHGDWARVYRLSLQWTSKSDAATEALRADAESTYASNPGSFIVNSAGTGPGHGLRYLLALEAATSAVMKANGL